ncbi:unnamed protein product, partial [Brenthis ino]
MLTRYFNQDPIENFFGNIRSYGVRNIAPNTVSFEGTFKALIINNYSEPHSSRANCEEDHNECLQSLDSFLKDKNIITPDIPDTNDTIHFNSEICFDQSIEIDAGQSNYVCGWVLKRFLKFIIKRTYLKLPAQIQPNDGLPTFICMNCNKTLEICLEFVKLCEKSDEVLRNALLTIIKDENLVTDVKKKNLHVCQDSTNLSCLIEDKNKTELKNETNNIMKPNNCNDNISNNFSNLNLLEKVSQKQQCFTCGKIMSSRFRLKTHLATHSGEKPYECPHCNKKFTIAQNLNVHMRIHTGEKPFNCTICGETFAQSSGLTAHKRKHTGQTPYQCVLCPRSFRTIGHLQYHIRCHTGEKNYECDTCSHAFITRSDLKQHLLTHIGDKPHVCELLKKLEYSTKNMSRDIYYSEKYYDEEHEYRHVVLPKEMVKLVPKNHLMSEQEWRSIGVQQSQGWVHYMTHQPEPHILLFRRKKTTTQSK